MSRFIMMSHAMVTEVHLHSHKNIGEACTGEYSGNINIFSIARILAESWIDLTFVLLDGMG